MRCKQVLLSSPLAKIRSRTGSKNKSYLISEKQDLHAL